MNERHSGERISEKRRLGLMRPFSWHHRTSKACAIAVAGFAVAAGMTLLAYPVSPVKNPASKGFATRTHTDSSGKRYGYVVFVPYVSQPNQKLPVILFLNGHGESGNDGLLQVSNNFGVDVWRKRSNFPFLAVCPQCSRSGSWDPNGPDGRRAIAILDEAISEFDGDPDRVYLTGVSRGGSGVWSLAAARPEKFAAIVPISAISSFEAAEIAAEANLPVWDFHNGKDRTDVVKAARTARETLINAGLSPLMTEYDRTGHNAWHSYNNPFLYEWLLEQNRPANAARPRFRLWSPEEVLEHWNRLGPGKWNAESKNELSSSTHDSDESALLCPDLLQAGDIHLDAYLDEGQRSYFTFMTAEGEQLAELRISLPTSGIGGLQLENGSTALFDPVGQRALRRGWNDIRMSRQAGLLTVSLNGWRAIAVDDPHAAQPIQWGLRSASGEPGSRWRFLRSNSQPFQGERGL